MTSITIPKNASKEERKAAIEKAAQAKKAEVKAQVEAFNKAKAPDKVAPKAKPDAKPAKVDPPAKVDADPNALTVSDVAREHNLDPKVARSKLRRHGFLGTHRATEGRWPKVKKGSEEYKALVAIITAEDDDADDGGEKEEKRRKVQKGDDA